MASFDSSTDFQQVMAALRLPPAGKPWRESWNISQASFDPKHLFFLSPEFVSNTCNTLGMSEEVRDALLCSLAMFEQHPALKRLAWHCHYLLFQAQGLNSRITEWPMLPRELSDTAGMFYAIVFLSGFPSIWKKHRDRGIPASITLDTLSDLELWIKEHRHWYGTLGFEQLGWLNNHFSGRLFKLGRLQFCFGSWSCDFHMFRHRRDRRVMMLAGHHLSFREDGQFDDADGLTGAMPSWRSTFTLTHDGVIQGNPISPYGRALSNPIHLPANEWEEILKQGDPVLGVHIPATGPMSHSDCGESFKQACCFFPKYFPDRLFHAFTCTSWLLDSQFERYLPDSSNIIRFMRELYLHPVPKAIHHQTFERVFGKCFEQLPLEKINEAPQNTLLQRILVQHVKAGGHWRGGGCVLFPEDLNWGMQVYRRRWSMGTSF